MHYKNQHYNSFTISVICPTVTILHTKHSTFGDKGQYFYVSKEELSKMIGIDKFNAIPSTGNVITVIQKGSQSWEGRVRIWSRDSDGNSNPHGRREEGVADGQWKNGDTIALKGCTSKPRPGRIYSIFVIDFNNIHNSYDNLILANIL